MDEYQEENRSSREWFNFGVLVVILVGTIVVIWALRPLIFGKIVPAVMGEGIVIPTTEPAPTTSEELTPSEEQPSETEGTTEEVTDGTTDTDEAADTETTDGEEADEETAVSEPSTDEAPGTNGETPTNEEDANEVQIIVTHTIKQGETLQSIATKYGITLNELTAANPQLTNPNYIRIGDKLTIPQSGE